MPHATLKLQPGVDQNRTLTLNEAAISETQLVRFVPDRQGLGLVQKLGGWTRYFPSTVGSRVRCLWAWQDTNANQYLGLGSGNRIVATTAATGDGTTATLTFDGTAAFSAGEIIYVTGVTPDGYNGTYTITAATQTTVSYVNATTGAQEIAGIIAAGDALSVISGGTREIITPRTTEFNTTPIFDTTYGSNQARVTINNSFVDSYDSAYIKTQVSVGGLVFFGLYPTTYIDGSDYFYIYATDSLGQPVLAASTVTGGGAVPSFAFFDAQAYSAVTLANHGYAVGDIFPVLVSLRAGSNTIYGNYTVSEVSSANVFRIPLGTSATTANVSSATWSGSVASVIYQGNYNFNVSDTVVVASVNPAGYNTAGATVTSVGNPVNITAASWSSGTATLTYTGDRAFTVGEIITVVGVNPLAYDGTYTVTAETASTVQFALVSDPGTYVEGGQIRGRVAYAVAVNPGAYVSGGTVFNSVAKLNGGLAQIVIYNTPGPLPEGTGYGVGGYGEGGYGSGVEPPFGFQGNPISTTDWSLDNWGEIFISCPVNDGIYTWRPITGATRASIIPEAPPVNDGMFVAMPQRQIIAWGSTFTGIQDQLLIRWCDVNDYNSWTAQITNQAGSYRLPKGSKIVGCIQGPQQGLVWTDLGVWAMQYVGPPYVYQFNELGNGCGMIARKAAASMNGIVYWMGQSQFFRLGGSGVETIRCPIWDVIFQDLDTDNLDRIRVAPNSRFNEISWYYPTTSNGGEVNAYVKYNISLDQWDFGTLSRTAWINQSVLGPPIGAGTTVPADEENLIYQHETSTDADGEPMASSFQTGYFAMTEGEYKVFVDQVWPDMKWGYYGGAQDADINLTFYVTDYPGQSPTAYGPFPLNYVTKFVTPRFRGRLMSIKMESSDAGSFWRIGGTRYRIQQDGKF